jgi:uncharacterized tellurite resistance protein B-like protein
MDTLFNFKRALLCFYWLMAGADGHISTSDDDPEWNVLKKMKHLEKISDKEITDFLNGDKNEDHLFEELMVNLVIVSHKERLRALAWMDMVMFADGYLHDNEAKLFKTVCNRFEISRDEMLEIRSHIMLELNQKISLSNG